MHSGATRMHCTASYIDSELEASKPLILWVSTITLLKMLMISHQLTLDFLLENHREESSFENHLTAKVLVVSSSSPLLNHQLIHSLLPTASYIKLFSLSLSVHLLQLLCGALPYCLLQAGCAFAA